MIDAESFEIGISYRFDNDVELLVAHNQLYSDGSENDFEKSYSTLGIGYYWSGKFRVHTEYKFDRSKRFYGSDNNEDVLFIGARYWF